MTIPTKPMCPYNPERVCRGQCFECHNEDEPVQMTAEERDAERGDIERAAERDEAMYLSIVREQEGSI